jgi:N-acetylglutamate synthase-like GNAT family acetyltransferase
MKYRSAHNCDRPAIDQILDVSFSRIYAYYAKKSFENLANTFCAVENEDVVGVINWRVYKAGKITIGYLFWLGVLPEHRKKGVGSELMRRAVQSIYETNGQIDIYTAAEKKNKISGILIEKQGFIKADKKQVKRKYGKNYSALFGEMMVMPWEVLFVKQAGNRE